MHLEGSAPTHHHFPLYLVHPISWPSLLLVALLELPPSSALVGPEPNKLRIVLLACVQVHDALCLCWALTVESALSALHGEVLYVL
jgi:hypothetical protein